MRIQDLHGKFRPADQEPLTAANAAYSQQRDHQGVMRAAVDYDVERAIALKARGYLESDAQRRFRYAQWAALVLSLLFIGSIVVLLAMLCVKVSDVFDAVDGSDTSAKVTTLMDMAVEGANNARLATQKRARRDRICATDGERRRAAAGARGQHDQGPGHRPALVQLSPELADRTRWVGLVVVACLFYPKKGGKWSTSCGPCCC